MFEKITELRMSAEDISRTYNEGFVGWREDDGTIRAVRVGSNHARNRIDIIGKGRIELTNPRLVMEHPDSGYAILNGRLLYVQRLAQRQWHRCLRQRCVVILNCSTSQQDHLVPIDEVANWMYRTSFPVTQDGITIYGRKMAEDSEGNVFLHGRCVKAGDTWASPLIETLYNEIKEA